jgi:outer membrane protein OmpA-like peptidoglycan-associated protein
MPASYTVRYDARAVTTRSCWFVFVLLSSILAHARVAHALGSDPVSIDFGTTVAVGTSPSRTVTINNPGAGEVTFTVSKNGLRAAEYALAGCATNCAVAPGGSAQFTVTFTPITGGAANVGLLVSSTDPQVAIPITASSITPAIDAPALVGYGNVEVATAVTRTLTITSSGVGALSITSANVTAAGGTFAVTAGQTGAQTVAAGQTTSWVIRCTPGAQGLQSGEFTIASNATNDATHVVPLQCTGTEGVLVLIPTSVTFGGVSENSGTVTRNYRLRNTGNLPVRTVGGVIDQVAGAGYSFDPTTPFPAQIDPGAINEVQLRVRFTPLSGSAGGPATATFSGVWGANNTALRAPPELAIDGDGLTAGFTLSPDPVAFGGVRFDATATRVVCISNDSESTVAIQTATITPAPGTSTGELAVTQIRRKACGSPGAGTAENLPETLDPGEELELTVTADPANRVGAMAAQLTVTSTLPANPSRAVALAATATTGAITLDPADADVDFGAVDIQGAPAQQTIRITNSGDGALELSAFARSDNGTNPRFALALPANTTLPPAGSLDIVVTYDPTVVTAIDEAITLTHAIGGVRGGPANGSIVIHGRGVDRELDVTGEARFPDTFRNPGAAAPVQAITVHNLGGAPLAVSAAMITAAEPAAWTLVDDAAVAIPAGGTHDFEVRFAPVATGASSATLVITSDDTSEPMAQVALSGTGIDRDVAFGAPVIDLGFTGVGVPVTIDDALLVASMNATTGFTIARIAFAVPDAECMASTPAGVAGPEAFAVGGDPDDTELAAATSAAFPVTFDPEATGTFVASAELFLDEDPLPQARVCVRGTAVLVEARGGGGCATGGGAGLGAALVVLAALATRRRALALLLIVSGGAAHAEDVTLSMFAPTPATSGVHVQVQSPDVGASGDWVVGAVLSHATDPLVLDAFANGERLGDHTVVGRSTLLELGGAYAFLGRFEAGVRLPLYMQEGEAFGDPRMMFTTQPASGTAVGDLALHVKARLWRSRRGDALGVAAQLAVPTATEGEHTGSGNPAGRVFVLGALAPTSRVTLSANAGAVLRPTGRFASLEQGSGATWGAGVAVRGLASLWLSGEVYGDLLASRAVSPMEWLAGIRWFPDPRVAIGVAAGRGITDAAGSPALRGVLTLSFAPAHSAAGRADRRDGRDPNDDDDRDGVANRFDKCPDVAEDVDLFDDGDGCPDLDNDSDGVGDAQDKCALEPEDPDGFEDGDGCPDLDDDRDGITDGQDLCPREPEDKDGFEDLDGCADPDNDKDGIADASDRCPREAEVINGTKDDDGCPDTGDSLIVLSPDRIETLDAIRFTGATAKLAKPAANVLGQIAATLRAHPDILRVRVTVHVNPTRDDVRDQQLSEQRAQAIRDWLVQWGLAASRIEARGFGGTKPLTDPARRGASTINERVELIILERR